MAANLMKVEKNRSVKIKLSDKKINSQKDGKKIY